MTSCTRAHHRAHARPAGATPSSGSHHDGRADRVVSTVMFLDVVASTERLASMGDRPWLSLLERLLSSVQREVERFGGLVVKGTGDGLIATFDGAAERAVRAALASTGVARAHGLDVRCGLHTGEIERLPHDIGGLAVHIAERVSGCATAGAVVVSRTTADVVAGSGIQLTCLGRSHLRGVPGEWELFAPGAAVGPVPTSQALTDDPAGVSIRGIVDAREDSTESSWTQHDSPPR